MYLVKLNQYQSIFYDTSNADDWFNCLETTSRSVLVIYPNDEHAFEIYTSKCFTDLHYLEEINVESLHADDLQYYNENCLAESDEEPDDKVI